MKSARADVQEYDTELPLLIAVLGRHLVCIVDVAPSTIMDEPTVINEDGDDKEEIQEAINYVEMQEVL